MRSYSQMSSFTTSFINNEFRRKYAKANSDMFLDMSLTGPEKEVYDKVVSKGGNTANVPVVDSVGKKVSNLDSTWLNSLCDMAKSCVDGMDKDSVYVDAVTALNNSRIFDMFYPVALKNMPIDYSKLQGSEHIKEISFLQQLLNMEKLDPMTVVNMFMKDIDITPENKQAVETVKASIINDVYNFNLSQNKEENKVSYNDIIKKLFISKVVVSNLKVMSNTNKYSNQIEVPMMYRDMSPLVNYCHKEIETAAMDGKSAQVCSDGLINNLNIQGQQDELVSPTSIRTENNFLTDYIDFIMNISFGDDMTVNAMKGRTAKIDDYLHDFIVDAAKRDEISKVWGYYGPEILKGVSPEVLPLLVADFEVARSGLSMDNKVVSNDGVRRL